MFIYKFKATMQFDSEQNCCGMVCAEDYPAAMQEVIDFVGEDYDDYTISLIATTSINLDEDIVEKIRESMVW